MTLPLDPAIERWKKYLDYDPTRWLLETNDPSILLWYQLDIANRPEDARGVIETRERVLYSDAVQSIFATQNEPGFWGDAETLAQPYYNATLWNLALLAELGIPRTSRRARNACEFVLQNFLNADGTFAGLNLVESGYLTRALGYFLRGDMRVFRAATALELQWHVVESDRGTSTCLWAWREFGADSSFDSTIHNALEELLEGCEFGTWPGILGFPQFNPRDTLFVLRVLAEHDQVHDPRAEGMVDWLLGCQDAKGRFPLVESLTDKIATPLESGSTASRWITLNALRVIKKLVASQKD
jgi:hypothetical protein